MQNTIQKIQNIINKEKQITAKELREQLKVSQVLIHRHLKTLCQQKKIKKIGSPPKVFYILNEEKKETYIHSYSKTIENNWLEIMPNGQFLYGGKGFDRRK